MLYWVQIFTLTRFKWRAELKRSHDRDKVVTQTKFRELILDHDADLICALRSCQNADTLKQLADEVCSSLSCMSLVTNQMNNLGPGTKSSAC
jgi:DNA primase catalytic subunit